MRSKQVLLLVPPHFYRVKTNDLIADEMFMNVMIFINFKCFFFHFFSSCQYLMNFPNFFSIYFLEFPIKEKSCICKMRCRCRSKHFNIHFWRIRFVLIPSKLRKDASYEGRKRWKNVFFSTRVVISAFDVVFCKSTFPYLYLDLACKHSCFPSVKGINWRNESKKTQKIIVNSQVLLFILSTDDITQ